LNLPPSPHVIGGRASRTTHPRVLAGLERFFSALFGAPMQVDNPFRWKTKATVLRELKAAGHADLCARAVSCAHTWEQTSAHPHCGRCSQCLDRRLTGLSAGLTPEEDDPDRYRMKVLTDARAGSDLILAERYVGAARDVDAMTGPDEFLRQFPEVADALPHTGVPAAEGLALAYGMYRDHSREVLDALARAMIEHSGLYVRGSFTADSMLAVAGVQGQAVTADADGRSRLPWTSPGPDAGVWIDHKRFTVWWSGLPCELGNTREFALFVRLAREPNNYVENHTLAADVWDDDLTSKGAIQRVACNLRRKLKDAKWTAVTVDGDQPSHYRLTGFVATLSGPPTPSAGNQR
jgi:hypothetical protein